jgi:hypothetical protein
LRSFFLLTGCLFLLTGTALAQIEEGDSEISIALSFDQSSTTVDGEDAGNSRNLQSLFSYGKFVSENHEIGGSLALLQMSAKGPDEDEYTGTPGYGFASIFWAIHFVGDNPMTVPYIGVDFGKSFFLGWDEDEDGEKPTQYGGTGFAGIKFFVSEKSTLGIRGQYRYQKYSVGDFDGNVGTISFLATISTLF